MIISLDAEKAFDKIQHSLIIHITRRSGIQGMYLNIIKANIQPADSQHQIEWKLKAIPLKSETSQGCLLCPYLFNIIENIYIFFPGSTETMPSGFTWALCPCALGQALFH